MAKQSKFNEKKITQEIVNCIRELDGVSQIISKGVKLIFDNDQLTVNAHIKVFYGINIPQLSYDIQSKAKSLIEETLSIPFGAINVFVDGIDDLKEQND